MYAMLDHAHIPHSLWGEAALTAAYLFNRSESRALPPGIMPYEMLHGTQPTLTHLHIGKRLTKTPTFVLEQTVIKVIEKFAYYQATKSKVYPGFESRKIV
jgi:hypothetical protein